MVRCCRSQCGIIRVWERVVPIELVLMGIARLAVFGGIGKIWAIWRHMGTRNLIAIAFDNPKLKVNYFLHTESDILAKKENPLGSPKEHTRWNIG